MPEIVLVEIRRKVGARHGPLEGAAEHPDPLARLRPASSGDVVEHPRRPLTIMSGEPEPGEVLAHR